MVKQAVLKYAIPDVAVTVPITVPSGAQIVHVGLQHDKIKLWIMHEFDQSHTVPHTRKFIVVGTGWLIDQTNPRHVGTVHMGPYVWHVFEVD